MRVPEGFLGKLDPEDAARPARGQPGVPAALQVRGGLMLPGSQERPQRRRAPAPLGGHGAGSKPLLLCIFTLPVLVSAAKDRKAAKGRRRGLARAPTAPPGLAWAHEPYSSMAEYEHSIQDMVRQLRNGSEPGDTKCQVNLRLSNRRSLSPWAYRINHDATRIPADIPEARCLCSGCINPFTLQEDRSMASVPIFSRLPVRRLLCPAPPGHRSQGKKCHKKYQMVMETIAVGCTCIF
ncbi:LOW QUALITY PROTEIN: interleukin-17B-like [Geothlypis trichas]